MNWNLSRVTTDGHCRLVLAMLIICCGAAQVFSQEGIPAEEDSNRHIRMFAPGDETAAAPPAVHRGDFSYFRVSLTHNWALLLEDAEGRRTGLNPFTETSYEEIPHSSYYVMRVGSRISDAHFEGTHLSIAPPPNGDYVLSIFGTVDTTCGFRVSCYGHESGDKPLETEFHNIPIARGAVHSYTVSLGNVPYAPYEVTGGFAGSANESVDVDRLLSYVSVAENVTTLPTGTDRFNLIIIYGHLATRETFAATLNGDDIADMFAPMEGGYEVVEIPLQTGENVLTLSIEGQTIEGTATDTDSLVLVVK